ncbi:MAG: alpha/beta hydrolase [Cryobacterium sp.]|nr:alpha/beta hydrolase [Cryobacterium sp.]
MSLTGHNGFGFAEPTRYVNGSAGQIAVYEHEGEGIPLVLVHGINMRAAVWSKITSVLGDRRVVAMDLRGHGKSTKNGPFYSRDYASDVWEVISQMDIPYAQLGGVSFGGLVGCLIAQEHPDRVQSVTGFGAALKGAHPDLDGGMQRLKQLGIEQYFRQAFRRDAEDQSEMLSQLVAFATVDRTDESVVEAITRTGFSEDLSGTIQPSGVPVQIVSGEFDLTCTPEAGRQLAVASGGSWRMVPGAGHVLPVEDPKLCAYLLQTALG